MEQGEQRTPKDRESQSDADQSGSHGASGAQVPAETEAAAPSEPAAAERVDWTALLENQGVVPDSEDASPVAVPKLRSVRPPRRRFLYVLAAVAGLFSVAASVAVVVALWRGNPDQAASSAAPSAGAAPSAEAPPPAPTRPAPELAPVPPSQPAASVAPPDSPQESKPPAEKPEPSAKTKKRSREPKESKEPKEPRAAKEPKEPKEPAAKEERSKEAAEESDAPPDPNLPAQPSASDVASAVGKVKPDIEACAKQHGVSGIVAVRMQVEPKGSIAWSAIREGGPEFHSCIGRALRGVRLSASQRGGTLIHNITLPAP